VAAEALTNAIKHAQASRVGITVAHTNGSLLIEVADDGVGGADETCGTGLVGLRDRVESLSGTLRVASPAGLGTSVHAEIPAG
jgi:signal transduction histidine kinase